MESHWSFTLAITALGFICVSFIIVLDSYPIHRALRMRVTNACTIGHIGGTNGPQVSIGYHLHDRPDLVCDMTVDSFALSDALCGEFVTQVTGTVSGTKQTFTCGMPQALSFDQEDFSQIFLPLDSEPCQSAVVLCAVITGTNMMYDGFV